MAADAPAGGGLLRRLHQLEDGLLVLAVVVMVAMAGLQIVLRDGFGTGLIWIDPMLRMLVLWIGMLGALVASRRGRHIGIDVLTRALPPAWRLPARGVACAFTAAVCGLLAWEAARYVGLEYGFSGTAFGDVPTWAVVTILPLAFGLIGVRYALFAVGFLRGHEPIGDGTT